MYFCVAIGQKLDFEFPATSSLKVSEAPDSELCFLILFWHLVAQSFRGGQCSGGFSNGELRYWGNNVRYVDLIDTRYLPRSISDNSQCRSQKAWHLSLFRGRTCLCNCTQCATREKPGLYRCSLKKGRLFLVMLMPEQKTYPAR